LSSITKIVFFIIITKERDFNNLRVSMRIALI